MILTAELSLYPLQDDYVPVILRFIDGLRERPGLQVITNAMSTQIQGDAGAVMSAVGDTLRASAEIDPRQVLVCKFIPMALALE